MSDLLTIKEASIWASKLLNKNVTSSNISYLIQYGRIPKKGNNGEVYVDKKDLSEYYNKYNGQKELHWKQKLGDDLNWALSFDYLKEKDTTKHIHRLHPYKGKFIPQLVEYFLDNHTDEFKTDVYFRPGDIVLDPFAGSGTTLVQANELGMHAVGIDISAFNTLISNVKLAKINFNNLQDEINKITKELISFSKNYNNLIFERELLEELSVFNKKYFPSPDYKIKIRKGLIDEKKYTKEKEKQFLENFIKLTNKYQLVIHQKQQKNNFMDVWFNDPVRREIDFVFEQIKKVNDTSIKKILTIILSRTMRSCRATTHADLATLKKPVYQTYYCRKHGKICKPLFSIQSWWKRYSQDTVKRLREFDKLRTNTFQIALQGDSRTIDILQVLDKKHSKLASLVKKNKFKGIFSSPPYVGLINYHEQHAYAYDLFGFDRKDELEIGPLYKGQGKEARQSYITGVSNVLINTKKYLQNDYDVFLVANDKYNLYPKIADRSGMKIVNRYKRPVLNRTEKDKSAYAEIIFHLKEQ
jgi:DNA modification methylase